jgi:hypothetical protein
LGDEAGRPEAARVGAVAGDGAFLEGDGVLVVGERGLSRLITAFKVDSDLRLEFVQPPLIS